MRMMKLLRIFAFIAAFCLAPACLAQDLTIRLIDATSGRPMPSQPISVAFLYDKKYQPNVPAKPEKGVNLETDANGEVHFQFPATKPAHFAAEARLDRSRWHCGCALLASPDELIKKGIVGSIPAGGSGLPGDLIKAVPGRIIFFASPLSPWERLLYPFEKE